MNALSDLGLLTVTERQAKVHVSGHPGRPELAEMYRWIRPQILLPVHGEARHLAEHARFGLSEGIAQAVVQKNGDIVRLAPGKPKKVGEARVGRLVLDGDVILPADGSTISERRKIALNGLITVTLAVNSSGRLAGDPMVRPFGVPVEEDRDDFLADAANAASRAYDAGAPEEKMRETVRLAVRRCASLWTGKKPQVEVMVIKVTA